MKSIVWPPQATIGWAFIGLLTHEQKQAGLFVSQDEDFIWLLRARSGTGEVLAVFPYETATVKEIRERAEEFV